MTNQQCVVEICVDSVASAINAQKGGARRIELCQDLSLGGTTPSVGLVKIVKAHCDLPIVAMVRSRTGDFCYDALEFNVMLEDIKSFKALGISEIVTGILTPEGRIDVDRMRQIVTIASPMKVVLHRAFDMCEDLFLALEDARALGIVRILSSGGRDRAFLAKETLCALRTSAKDICMMPGAGIDAAAAKYFKAQGFTQIHLSASVKGISKMRYQKNNLAMGVASKSNEYAIMLTDAQKVREVVSVFCDKA